MGLDFINGDDAHWSYSGFNSFRRRLAKEIGIDLDEMQGFGHLNGKPGWRSWDEVDDPIKPFLMHSDCDGEMSPEECLQVGPRLREIVSSWPAAVALSLYGGTILPEHDKVNALKLADAMEENAREGKTLIFC